jgi:hypothetical protein
LNSCPIDKGWDSKNYQTIDYDGVSLVEAQVSANEKGFTVLYNGQEIFYKAVLEWKTFKRIEIQLNGPKASGVDSSLWEVKSLSTTEFVPGTKTQ